MDVVGGVDGRSLKDGWFEVQTLSQSMFQVRVDDDHARSGIDDGPAKYFIWEHRIDACVSESSPEGSDLGCPKMLRTSRNQNGHDLFTRPKLCELF